jgi:hypothetical protein
MLLFSIATLLVFFTPIQHLIFLFSDDAYYYLLTAHNIASGLGSTFDGNNLTNGYHPQWMLLILPIFFLIDNLTVALKMVVVFQLLLASGSIYFTYSLINSKYNKTSAIFGVIILFSLFSPFALMFNGLESGLLLFWITFTFYLVYRFDLLSINASLYKKLALGVLLSGIATTRLDTIFILASLALLLLLRSRATEKHTFLYIIKFYFPSLYLMQASVFAYFNNRSTINLDGLINSYSFQQNIADGRIDLILIKK